MDMDQEERDHLEFELSLFELHLEKNPDDVKTMHEIAMASTKLGMFEKGLEMDLKIVQLQPDNCIALYNLACSFSLVGEPEKGIGTMHKALLAGFDDMVMMAGDPDLNFLREDGRLMRLLDDVFDDDGEDVVYVEGEEHPC